MRSAGAEATLVAAGNGGPKMGQFCPKQSLDATPIKNAARRNDIETADANKGGYSLGYAVVRKVFWDAQY